VALFLARRLVGASLGVRSCWPRGAEPPGTPAFKAYLICDGAPVNQYSPFYLWRSLDGMNRFLWGGGGFQGIVADFGRPAVRHWTGVAFAYGPEHDVVPRAATRRTERLPADEDPAVAVERALADLDADVPGTHSTALAVDPASWELVHFTLWADAAEGPGIHYEVLHLSTPEELPSGRRW
jgi:Domain of unknown function (DUF4865)